MGGPGSGRWKDRRRKTVESCWMLDVNQLSKMGCLRPGWSSTCKWSNGNDGASINLYAEAGRLHLSYTVQVGGEWEDVAEIIPIVYASCRFGGSRTCFTCPGPQKRNSLLLSSRSISCFPFGSATLVPSESRPRFREVIDSPCRLRLSDSFRFSHLGS